MRGCYASRRGLLIATDDIEHFKAINDNAGHDVGGTVRCHFADLLRHPLRPMDAVDRIGGEEMLLVLTNSGLDGEAHMLDRVRGLIGDVITLASQPVPNHTFSAGIAVAAADGSVDGFFRRAEQALFQAKRSGRNRDRGVNSRPTRL